MFRVKLFFFLIVLTTVTLFSLLFTLPRINFQENSNLSKRNMEGKHLHFKDLLKLRFSNQLLEIHSFASQSRFVDGFSAEAEKPEQKPRIVPKFPFHFVSKAGKKWIQKTLNSSESVKKVSPRVPDFAASNKLFLPLLKQLNHRLWASELLLLTPKGDLLASIKQPEVFGRGEKSRELIRSIEPLALTIDRLDQLDLDRPVIDLKTLFPFEVPGLLLSEEGDIAILVDSLPAFWVDKSGQTFQIILYPLIKQGKCQGLMAALFALDDNVIRTLRGKLGGIDVAFFYRAKVVASSVVDQDLQKQAAQLIGEFRSNSMSGVSQADVIFLEPSDKNSGKHGLIGYIPGTLVDLGNQKPSQLGYILLHRKNIIPENPFSLHVIIDTIGNPYFRSKLPFFIGVGGLLLLILYFLIYIEHTARLNRLSEDIGARALSDSSKTLISETYKGKFRQLALGINHLVESIPEASESFLSGVIGADKPSKKITKDPELLQSKPGADNILMFEEHKEKISSDEDVEISPELTYALMDANEFSASITEEFLDHLEEQEESSGLSKSEESDSEKILISKEMVIDPSANESGKKNLQKTSLFDEESSTTSDKILVGDDKKEGDFQGDSQELGSVLPSMEEIDAIFETQLLDFTVGGKSESEQPEKKPGTDNFGVEWSDYLDKPEIDSPKNTSVSEVNDSKESSGTSSLDSGDEITRKLQVNEGFASALKNLSKEELDDLGIGDSTEPSMTSSSLLKALKEKESLHQPKTEDVNKEEAKENTAVKKTPDFLIKRSARKEEDEGLGYSLRQRKSNRPRYIPSYSRLSEQEMTSYRNLYEEFLGAKRECGESIDNLTFTRFQNRLVRNRASLIERFDCRTVSFQVAIKKGKATLKATPIM